MKQKFTFKKRPRQTGLDGVGYPHQSVNVKHDGKVVGHIWAPNWRSEGWRIQLALRVENRWQWKFLKPFESEESARLYLKDTAAKWIARGLHHFESDYE